MDKEMAIWGKGHEQVGGIKGAAGLLLPCQQKIHGDCFLLLCF